MEAPVRGGPRPALPIKLDYDPGLPITAHRAEIVAALARHPALIICGATGSGKSTQLPKLCLEAGRGTAGLIGHTQPRRIAARALATRLAEELGTTVGGAVGYQVRFTDHTGPQGRVKLMTDGILLQELESDPRLRRYDTLIIDEAHERSLNIDLLLGVVKRLLPRRSDLRLIVTSATIDPGRLSAFFAAAPIIEVSGRSYPVEVRYRPLVAEDEDAAELSLPEGIVEAVRELDLRMGGASADTLVFLPGEKHIREAADALSKARLAGTEMLSLYARLSAADQARIFQKHSQRRVILATNVAETSLTVPGIRHVVDSGLARISRYSLRGKVQRLHVERISRASAEQRKGRCGREAEGICIRLYSEEDFAAREAYTPPEILRTNLASVILRMATLGLGDPESFPFLDPPDTRLINDGVRLLEELQAMDAERRVTSLGRKVAALPVDPRLGRMLLAAARQRCLAEMLVIAAFLETQDPRERPADMQRQADEKHALFADSRSDFVTVLNLWRAFGEQAAALSGNQLRKWCREHFLSFLRMREWQDLHHQLTRSVRELDLRPNHNPASYAELHQAILTGFLGSVGTLNQKREYDGPRGMRFVVAPGSPLAAKPPKWLVAGSLVETTRLYARMVASINPAWIERAGAHLVKRAYSEPHWVASRGFVAAYESVSLYGLALATQRRVNYGPVAPKEAREIFIREALLTPAAATGATLVRGGFLEANRGLREEIERLEAKIRRRDILVGERSEIDFYAARIPERVSSIGDFEQWRAQAERGDPRVLYMSHADLMEREAGEVDDIQYPDALEVGGNKLPLRYRFEPAEPDDGVTLIVPDLLLDALEADRLAWLIPGWRLEKIIAVLRELPKAQRKLLVPVPEHARRALEALTARPSHIANGATTAAAVSDPVAHESLPGFYAGLAAWISERIGGVVTPADLAALPLPDWLRVNIRVIDAQDLVLAEGRDLLALKRKVLGTGASTRKAAEEGASLHRQWDFGDLPVSRQIERNGLLLTVYPAIEDRRSAVAWVEARGPAHAEELTRRGVTRLALLALPQQARYWQKRIAEDRQLVLQSRGLELVQPLADALSERIFLDCFAAADAPLPRDREAFTRRMDEGRTRLEEAGGRVVEVVRGVLKEWRAVRGALDAARNPASAAAVTDINAQLAALLPADFIESTPYPWLGHLPRYLKAIVRRLSRLPAEARRDGELASRVRPFVAAVRDLQASFPAASVRSELTMLRWMIEELRVSLYAQDLKAAVRVSEQRLAEQLERAKAEARK
ncbi:MAG TPA: ATP-dependent RNA helicase HrpA [Steroidobacteraceae bacterium]|nr:ATP-dependent RNA helicase HrpA [Steroidobacteraceae bacterium]